MNNLAGRIAELVALRKVKASDESEKGFDKGIDWTIPLINDLHAALQAKDAEIAELRGLLKWAAQEFEKHNVSADNWYAEYEQYERGTTALAGKEQPK